MTTSGRTSSTRSARHAPTGLGKPAALYIYPFESHATRAIENFLDLWARWLEWFDKYVKNAPPGRRPRRSSRAGAHIALAPYASFSTSRCSLTDAFLMLLNPASTTFKA